MLNHPKPKAVAEEDKGLNHPKPKAVAEEDKTIQTQIEKKAASTPKKRKGAGEMKTWKGLIRLPSQVDRNGHGVLMFAKDQTYGASTHSVASWR